MYGEYFENECDSTEGEKRKPGAERNKKLCTVLQKNNFFKNKFVILYITK